VNDSLIASQRPTLLHLPPDVADFTIGDIAVEFAAEVCGLRLYDWQAWCLRNILARRTDGNWAARDSGMEVPRQNGKNSVLEALELYLIFLGGAKHVVHSAHEQPTAEMHFTRLRTLIESSDELMDEMPRTHNGGFHTANGKERIELADGRRIVFKTRTKSAGRGPSPDAIVFDEAMELDARALGALTPSLSARRKAMLVFTSSSPYEDSQQLHRLRARALGGEGGRLFYAAWNSEPDADPRDEANWFRCNPSLEMGDEDRIGKQIDAMRADLDTMTPDTFAVDHLGIPQEPLSDRDCGPIPLTTWDSLIDATSTPDSKRCAIALDTNPDRTWFTLSMAGERSDGLIHCEITKSHPDKASAIAMADDIAAKLDLPVVVSETSGLADDLVNAVTMKSGEQALATSRLIDATRGEAPLVRHRGEPAMRRSIEMAQTKPYGDGGVVWSRRTTSGDISPLTALTMAYHALSADVQLGDPLAAILA